jgi:hypothetical protein
MGDVNSNLKISDLTKKLQEKNKEIARLTKEFSEKIETLHRENIKLQKRSVVLSDSERYKKALRLYANGFGAGNIYRMLTTEFGIDITVEEVRMLVDKVDYLSDELQDYYNKCKKEFGDKIKIDKGIFANTMYKKFQLLENVVSEQLQKALEIEDEKTVLICTAELKNIYKEMSAVFFKNGFESSIDSSMADNIDAYNKTRENASNVVKFKKVEVM